MPAKSKAQQKFMGMVLAAKRGGKAACPEVAKAARSMSTKSARDFASTSTKGMKEHVMGAMRNRIRKQKYESRDKKS